MSNVVEKVENNEIINDKQKIIWFGAKIKKSMILYNPGTLA